MDLQPEDEALSLFESAESGALSKSEFRKHEEKLRVELLAAQRALREAGFPVLLVLCGVDGAGKAQTANLLLEWLDPRGIVTCAYGPASTDEAERPEFWRYWRDLPGKGRMGVYLSAWYHEPLIERVYGRLPDGELERQLEQIRSFEQAISDGGALILKIWMHLGEEEQAERLRTLESDPLLAWRVTESAWKHLKLYDSFVEASEQIIRATDTVEVPWTIVNGRDNDWVSLRAGELLRDRIEEHLDRHDNGSAGKKKPRKSKNGGRKSRGGELPILDAIDLDKSLERKEYRRQLMNLQARLNPLFRRAREAKLSTVIAFEGWDAGGKGGAIRRLTAALDARHYRVKQIAAPTDEEREHHYLWRFWRHLSRAGFVTIFDRTWYGRVLVERVEGYATESEWKRAYGEINEFESQLAEFGVVVVKFWMHISRDEQKLRFERREERPSKSWKLTEEDWRNRERWWDYELAVEEMLERTGTAEAPWTVVEANDKRFARIKVLETLCVALEQALGDTTVPGSAPIGAEPGTSA